MDELLKLVDINKSYCLTNVKTKAHTCTRIDTGVGADADNKRKVLDKINFSIKKGAINCIIGESGSGKTTLCKIIIGIEKADSGKILYNNREMDVLKKRSPDECFDIQYIFQDPYAAIHNESTILTVLKEPLKLGKRYNRHTLTIAEALELVGLSEKRYLNQKVKILSGGQRQRLAIARALLVNPKLIIADECTSMLDDEASERICDIFLKLKIKYNISFLIVTHNIKIIKNLSEHVFILDRGTFIENGTIEEIILSPKTEYSSQWVNSMLRIEGEYFNE